MATRQDSDGDGLSGIEEAFFGSDPNSSDTDGDGLSDADEMKAGTDPTKRDSDGDGFSDQEEVAGGSNPTDATEHPTDSGPITVIHFNPLDADGDGVTDYWEKVFNMDPGDQQTINGTNDRDLADMLSRERAVVESHDSGAIGYLSVLKDTGTKPTPQEQAAADAEIEQLQNSPNLMAQYRGAVVDEHLNGVPIPADLQDRHEAFMKDVQDAMINRNADAYARVMEAQGTPATAGQIEAFKNPDASKPGDIQALIGDERFLQLTDTTKAPNSAREQLIDKLNAQLGASESLDAVARGPAARGGSGSGSGSTPPSQSTGTDSTHEGHEHGLPSDPNSERPPSRADKGSTDGRAANAATGQPAHTDGADPGSAEKPSQPLPLGSEDGLSPDDKNVQMYAEASGVTHVIITHTDGSSTELVETPDHEQTRIEHPAPSSDGKTSDDGGYVDPDADPTGGADRPPASGGGVSEATGGGNGDHGTLGGSGHEPVATGASTADFTHPHNVDPVNPDLDGGTDHITGIADNGPSVVDPSGPGDDTSGSGVVVHIYDGPGNVDGVNPDSDVVTGSAEVPHGDPHAPYSETGTGDFHDVTSVEPDATALTGPVDTPTADLATADLTTTHLGSYDLSTTDVAHHPGADESGGDGVDEPHTHDMLFDD